MLLFLSIANLSYCTRSGFPPPTVFDGRVSSLTHLYPLNGTAVVPPCHDCTQEMQRNRLSKFEYFAGDEASTLASEEILLTSAPKNNSIHSAGWVGFKPSVYGTTVSIL